MRWHLMIGTYHKTGTVWFARIFRDLAHELGVEFRNVSRHSDFYRKELRSDRARNEFLKQIIERPARYILFDSHCRFTQTDEEIAPNFRGLRVVRHPVSVISSAAAYHVWSEERWLRQPRMKFFGRSYRQAIRSLKSSNQRYRFEMHPGNVGFEIIQSMASFRSNVPFYTARYEDFIDDRALNNFAKALSFLGLEANEMEPANRAIRKHSLFGDFNPSQAKHVQNPPSHRYGEDWDHETWEMYRELIGSFADELGYSTYANANSPE